MPPLRRCGETGWDGAAVSEPTAGRCPGTEEVQAHVPGSIGCLSAQEEEERLLAHRATLKGNWRTRETNEKP